MRVIDRFQGAWAGAAMAVAYCPKDLGQSKTLASRPQGSDSFQALFEQEALTIRSLQNIQFPAVDRPEQRELLTVIHILIISLLLHQTPLERAQIRQQINPAPEESAVLELLSELIALQFTLPNHPLKLKAEAQQIWASIQAAITQQLPLQDAIATLKQLPQISPWSQDIAIALYCWQCTPHNPSISIARANRGLRLQPHSVRSRHGDFLPHITGFLSGLTQEQPTPKSAPSKGIQHLFNHWAGINPHHPNHPKNNDLIIFAPGILKPRPSTDPS